MKTPTAQQIRSAAAIIDRQVIDTESKTAHECGVIDIWKIRKIDVVSGAKCSESAVIRRTVVYTQDSRRSNDRVFVELFDGSRWNELCSIHPTLTDAENDEDILLVTAYAILFS